MIIPPDLVAGLADRYELRGVVGRGGMATVYWAMDLKHQREVAIKVLGSDLAANVGAERFLREIAIAAGLQHPHILMLIDSGQVGDSLYYVMPLADGGSLRTRIEAGPMQLDETLAIVERVGSALAYAHEQGVVHRDIKPENILFSRGYPVVADFGIAKAITSAGGHALTRTGFAVGTMGYMSPEQAAGSSALGPASDVYSLACVTYEMLVGAVPGVWLSETDSNAGRIADVPEAHRAVFDQLPAHVEPTLARALALRPGHRLADPTVFFGALRGQALPAPATPPEDDILAPLTRSPGALVVGSETSPVRMYVFPAGLFAAPSHVGVDTTIAGEVPPSAHSTLLLEIQTELGDVGTTKQTDRVLTWSNKEWLGDGYEVTVRAENGQTTMTATETMRSRKAAATLGSVVGGGVATFFLVAFADEGGLIVANLRILVATAAVMVPGTVIAGRAMFRDFARSRRKRLGNLMRKLVEVSRKAIGGTSG